MYVRETGECGLYKTLALLGLRPHPLASIDIRITWDKMHVCFSYGCVVKRSDRGTDVFL
jgi:hypothetical protein